MGLSHEQYNQIYRRIRTESKRICQYIDWPGVMALLGFVSLASVSLAKGYPSYFVFSLAIIGLVLVCLAAHNSYIHKSTALVDKYDERFFERMKRERACAAQYLLGETTDSDGLEDILDFFQSPIAEKVISGAIDEQQIYSLFYHWIRLYWQGQSYKKYVENYRKEEPAAWESLETLYKQMSILEKIEVERESERRCSDQDLILNSEKLKKYLQQEARLKIDLLVTVIRDSTK